MSTALLSIITTSASPAQAAATIRDRVQTKTELPVTEDPQKQPHEPSAVFSVELVKIKEQAGHDYGFTLYEKADIGQSFRDSGRAKVITHDAGTLISLLSVVGRKLGEVNMLIKGQLPQATLQAAPKRSF